MPSDSRSVVRASPGTMWYLQQPSLQHMMGDAAVHSRWRLQRQEAAASGWWELQLPSIGGCHQCDQTPVV